MELRRDLRKGANKTAIVKDRQEIRDDLKKKSAAMVSISTMTKRSSTGDAAYTSSVSRGWSGIASGSIRSIGHADGIVTGSGAGNE